MSILEQAKRLRDKGVSVIPIRCDGSKAPDGKVLPKVWDEKLNRLKPVWSPYQERVPTDAELLTWFGNGERRAYAIVQGRTRELVDFDPEDDPELIKLFDEYKRNVEARCPGLLVRLPLVETPMRGRHIYYRTDVAEGNQVLAKIADPYEAGKAKVLFETRGVGGYALGPGNPIDAHTVKRPYRLISGPPVEDAPLISADERKALFEAARGFNRFVESPREIVPKVSTYELGDENDKRPGTLFNRSATWKEILEPKGWQHIGGDAWRRPGKPSGSLSAQAFDEPPILINYSSNADFEVWSESNRVSYTKFAAYALLYHDNEFAAAGKALREQGYTDEPPTMAEQEAYFEATFIELPTDQDDLASGEQSEPALAPAMTYEKMAAAIVSEMRKPKPRAAKKPKPTKEDTAKLYEEITARFISSQNENGQPLLYTGGQTYSYDGCRYAPCTELPVMLRTFCHDLNYPRSNNIIGNVANLVQADSWESEDKVGRMPFWRSEGNPFKRAKDVIAFRNGLLDISEIGKGLIPHTTKWCSTVCLPFAFDPTATCPLWRKFLAEVLAEDQDTGRLLQEFIGYCLSSDTSLQKALVLVGKPRSGKGTIQRLLADLIGKDNVTGFSLDSLSKEFGLSALVNRSVALVGEVELQANPQRNKITEILKSIIGEDEVCINVKHDPNMRSLRLPTRFVIAANGIPRLMDSSGAMFQRLLFIPFEQSFRNREDPELADKLRTELSGIANWAIEGLNRLRRNGGRFTLGTTHKQLADKYASETTPVLAWLSERALVSKWADPGDLPDSCIVRDDLKISKDKAFADYHKWATERDVCNPDRVWFGRDVQTLLPRVKNTKIVSVVTGKQVHAYNGLGLKS